MGSNLHKIKPDPIRRAKKCSTYDSLDSNGRLQHRVLRNEQSIKTKDNIFVSVVMDAGPLHCCGRVIFIGVDAKTIKAYISKIVKINHL